MHQARDLGTKTVGSAKVSARQLEDELVVYEIAATVGGHTEVQRHSIGAGGTNPKQPAAMSAAELQAWLDEKRQIVADNAAWHAAMEDASAQVK
jgi:hypothetical protein